MVLKGLKFNLVNAEETLFNTCLCFHLLCGVTNIYSQTNLFVNLFCFQVSFPFQILLISF